MRGREPREQSYPGLGAETAGGTSGATSTVEALAQMGPIGQPAHENSAAQLSALTLDLVVLDEFGGLGAHLTSQQCGALAAVLGRAVAEAAMPVKAPM